MSLGVNLLMYLTEITSKSLGKNFLSKINEIHHKYKKENNATFSVSFQCISAAISINLPNFETFQLQNQNFPPISALGDS